MFVWCIFFVAQLVRFIDIAYVRAPQSEEAARSRAQLIAIEKMGDTLSLIKQRLDARP